MNSLLTDLSAQQLRKAAEIKERIDSLQDELRYILGQSGEAATHSILKSAGPGRKRRMSAAGRAAISAAAKARWASIKGRKPALAPGRRPKRKMSAASKAKIAAAARERWKKAKAAGRKTL